MPNAALEEKLAALLLAHQGEYLSGEAVSREIGVTRSAVWKAAGRLRQEGWILESGSNRGYRLAQVPDLVTAPVVEHFLPAPRSAPVLCFEELDSTITHGQRLILEGTPDRTVVIANRQTGGMGRIARAAAAGESAVCPSASSRRRPSDRNR